MQLSADLLWALDGPGAETRLRQLDAGGKLTTLFPELEAGRDFIQPELHYYDVLGHNFAAVAALDAATASGDVGDELRALLDWIDFDGSLNKEIEGLPLLALTRLACLLHDVAKPATAVHLEGRLRFPRHGPRGGEMLNERLPQLGFGPEATGFVARMVRYHLRPGELVKAWPPTDAAVRRFVRDLDGHVLPVMLVNLADGMATRGPRQTREQFRRHCGFVDYILARSVGLIDEGEAPLLTGEDLIRELDLSGGRVLGAVLTSIRRAQAEGGISTREEALALARAVLAGLDAAEG